MTASTAEDLFRTGLTHHQAGRVAEAEGFYRQAVAADPNHAESQHQLGLIAAEAGQNEAAIALIRRTVELAPDHEDAWYHLGNLYQAGERLDEAIAAYQRALAVNPNNPRTNNNIGSAFRKLGRLDEALASFRRTLAAMPNVAEVHRNIAGVLQSKGQLPDAILHLKRAIELNPNFPPAHTDMAVALQAVGRLDDAIKHFRHVLTLTPQDANAHSNLAIALSRQGDLIEAFTHYRTATTLQPNHLAAQHGMSQALGRLVPAWHVGMMNDKLRNDAYEAALTKLVTPETHVFEIGTGSGLLSMMAARLGAAHVTTCEAVPLIAETAQKIVAANGYNKTITVISKKSTELELGKDMRERGDLLVSEILSSEFLGEGLFHSIEDAKRRLLKPGARMIPARGSVMATLIGGEGISSNIRVDKSSGFDLSIFNSLVPRLITLHRYDLDTTYLTDDIEAFQFDFEKEDYFPPMQKKLEVPITASGRCVGILPWNRLYMEGETIFENHPRVEASASAWQHVIYVLPKPIEVIAGQTAILSAMHDRSALWFSLDEVK